MPDKQRRRKNNKNKRKNNRNNKSEQSPNKVSANDIENIVECVNDEVGQSNVTQNLENSLEKIPSEVKEFSTALNSNETKPENKIPENESQKTAGPSNESPCSPVDSSIKKTEDEVDCACYDTKEKITDASNLNNIPNLFEVCDTQIGNTITSEQKESDTDIVSKRDESHVEYLVESPDQKTVHNPKLSNNVKSESVDNDDSPTITEVTEEIGQNNENNPSLSIIDCKNAIITDADSDIEWQKTDDLKGSDVSCTSDAKILPVTSIPLNTAQCDKANILKSEDEISLRNFLQTLNLSANPEDSNTLEIRAEIEHIINREIKHRLRKRGLAEDLVFQRGPSRSLTVIDEEGSSESSATSRRQSYLSEKASDTDELEDDVFEKKIKTCKDQRSQIRPAHRVYPTFQTIPQECIRVDAKIKEPEITEARGSWAMKQTETLTGAELVYLTDSSSSTSSVYDLNDDKETAEDNDVSVRIITPTIEVTDTEKLLTNSCLMKQETDKKDHKIDTKAPNGTGDTSTQNDKHNNPHEIFIESIDNIETNLYVKEIPDDSSPMLGNKINDSDLIKTIENCPKIANKYDLEMKVIKCELNDAINNLIKEVTSDSECVQSENLLQRQDSSSSLGSSQCTAKYNPNHSSLNDVADIISENHIEPYTQLTHVKEVYERAVTDKNDLTNKANSKAVTQPYTLKEVCLQKITSLPYGDKILEELANVSECLQNMSLQNATLSTESKKILESHSDAKCNIPERNSIPPPIQPRTSSFKITKDEYNQEFLSTRGRNIRCVSPSNKMLMEKTNTVIKDDKPRFSLSTQNNLKHTDDHFIQRDNNKNYQMKSETGSRLLSLLRDNSVKSNSSPFLYKSNTNENLEKLSKIGFSKNFRQYAKSNKCTVSQFESHEKYKSDTFRPLPSPKLRSFSSSFYESDDSSDITENTLRKMHNEKRYFHYSTGNLNKDIENDVSSIQNMHRHYMNVRDKSQEFRPRRPSLPKDLCDQQMEYIRQKEKEVDAELERLQRENTSLKNKRSPRAPMISEESFERRTLSSSYKKPLIKEVHSTKTEKKQMSSIFSSSEEELRREKMYSEYISQMAEREKRREHKVIKITKPSPIESANISKSTTALDSVDRKVNNPIEGEFISKARERWNKLGIMDPETEDEKEQSDVYREPKVIEHKIKVIDAGEEKDVKRLPSHLQEFVSFTVKDTDTRNSPETVMITPTFKARSSSPVVWRPGAPAAPVRSESSSTPGAPPPPPPPVWSPSSAPSPQSQRKTFRPVHFEESPPPRRKASAENGCLSGSDSEGRLKTSHSAPVTGLNTLGLSTSSRLPRAQNPTVTLLQKAREGLLQQTNIIQQERDARLPRDRPSPPKGDPVYALRAEYDASEGDGRRSKMSDGHKKVEGIGPTTKDGMPVTLRSEVKDPSRWYKKMYDTIHKNKYDDDYVTIRYKNRRGETIQRPSSNRSQYAYFDPRSGYLSEPEGRRVPSAWSDYDSDATGPRRRTASVQEERRNESSYTTNKYSTLASARASQEVYKGQPGRIENYVPGRSSVIDKEAKQWWDEVMDIFDGQQNMSNSSLPQASPKEKKDITSTILSKSNMARALKESGYESDSTLIFRRREETDGPLSPAERRAAYRDLQAGGEPPLRGFRSPAPPRQDDSEIEYIPISKTLTKIRVHKVPPHVREVICYPVTRIENDRVHESRKFCAENLLQDPPAPPRRVSSKNSRTLQLVTSTKPNTKTLQTQEQSNVDFLKNKISNKLNRQNTHTIFKKGSSTISKAPVNSRIMSTSAPPAINRSKYAESLHSPQRRNLKQFGTSSFSSPRRTLTPNNYPTTNLDRFGDQQRSIKIEGGVGRKTPISNILDKATAIDKLWSSQKRNERIDFTKIKPKNTLKTGTQIIKPILSSQIRASNISRQYSPPVTHKSRDMLRTSEKIQRMKHLNQHTKSVPCLFKKDSKSSKETSSTTLPTSKSISNLVPLPVTRNQNSRQIKSAVITNLKKKKISSGNAIVAKPIQISNADKKDEVKTKLLREKLKQNSDGNTRGLLEVSSNGITKYSKCSKSPKGNINSNNIYCNKKAFEEDLSNSYDSFDSNTFFQHLFLRNMEPLSMKELSDQSCAGLVFEKAKLFQSLPDKISNYSHSNSLNTYLINRKPVSLSRFVKWDRNPSPISYKKPRSISWPGKMDGKIRKFESLHVPRSEMGSTSSLTSIRSKSEPPVHKLYFSQTSRPVSPTVIFHKKTVQRFSSPPKSSILKSNIKSSNKVYSRGNNFTSPANKSPSVKMVPSVKTPQNKDECKMIQLRVPLSSRSVSPQDSRSICFSRSHSTSPVSIRSPSYRKIHLTRTQNKLEKVNKKENRSCSAESKSNRNQHEGITRVNSEPNLYSDDPEYDEYIRDIQSTKSRSERFRELNRYYAYLERVAELEKKTCYNNDLLVRKKDEEIIDFDRWKKIRAIERAEEELNNLYEKLRQAQRDNDVLFYPRDVKDFRWKFDSERGLKIKEKSVEDLKDELQQKSTNDYDSLVLQKPSDAYKPLWRGKSVAETAFDINNKREKKKEKGQPIRTHLVAQDDSFQELRKKIGIGNRLWSSLSIDQVTALKDQLNAIYSKELESKSLVKNETQKYEIEVNNLTKKKNPNLYVRCSSLGTPRETPSLQDNETLVKSQSIASIDSSKPTEKEMKNNANRIQMSLTECEKKLISQNISKEVLNKLNKLDHMPLISFDNNCQSSACNNNNKLLEDQNNKQKECKTRHLIYPNVNSAPSNQSSASETDTGSSDVSGKTVIYRDNKIGVKKKVEYFESVKCVQNQPKTIFHARENSDEQKEKSPSIQLNGETIKKPVTNNLICQSQSCTNFKELFGESNSNNFLSLPLKTALRSRSPSPYSGVHERDRNTPDTLPYSSNETISRSRSPSPDPERVWRTYLKFSRGGEVRRLVRRFDSPSSVGAILRRHRSDPEIARNVYKNNWSTIEGEPSQRQKWKTLTVARVPLRPTNRFMPHIDIISKLAALRKRPTTRSRSAEEAIECRPGEVERIRRKFETMSLLGQIYSSAPDIRELNEFPFLAGPWIAHQYPKPSDNNRSVTSPDKFVRGRTSPVKKDVKVATTKKPLKLNTILKHEPLSKQAFDSEVHRPASRYEPPRTPPRPPVPPAAWPYHLAPFVMPSRNTVQFQEGESAPEPPRRSAYYGSYSDTESPNRRYVESDVNIHYRCPVRRDPLPLVPERELARQQAEHMKSLYREQKRNKYLQDNNIDPRDIEAFDASMKELQDAQNRRHQDNFMPSQKLVIPPNRYDEAEKIVARALYTFNGQTSRELSFRKGDFISVRRQIDANWYEGEIHGRIGLFPYNYVELLKGDGSRSPRRSAVIEGRAKAKFDFTAQTNLELPLKKGEIVTLTRRIDQNWWEGRNGHKTGIFPDSYVTVLQEPSQSKPESQPILNTDKPVASPAAHGLLNGSDKRSMGTHSYTPQQNSSALANAPPATQPLPGYAVSKNQRTVTPSDRGYGPPTGAGVDLNNTEPLYVDTNAEAIPYRAMYKYRPQNPDELELSEGDTVYVLEKCDDGWYVGSSQRTGRFGTFPGNYVERI